MTKLTIDLPNHPYDITVERGSLLHVGSWLEQLWVPQKVAIITDNHVASLYAEGVKLDLESHGFDVKVFDFLQGEASKNLTTATKAYEFLADFGMTRSDGILALGGGVVGDLAGFVASTYLRGIHIVQVPTTLLAQVDSSVGGKTGVNMPWAKNAVGTFAQPDGVLIDPEVLKTLSDRHLREGIGEIIKAALIADRELWDTLVAMRDEFDLRDHYAEDVIEHAIHVKRQAVVADELDNGARLSLNFGHTIGHAIEAVAGYGHVNHGEAVAIGMIEMSRNAERLGLSPQGLTQMISDLVTKFHLPTGVEPWDGDALFEALTHDKKARGQIVKTIIVPEIGTSQIHEVPISKMKEYLEREEY
jgi:3-dehydroquinate synthase